MIKFMEVRDMTGSMLMPAYRAFPGVISPPLILRASNRGAALMSRNLCIREVCTIALYCAQALVFLHDAPLSACENRRRRIPG